jgi:hypothetical protein
MRIFLTWAPVVLGVISALCWLRAAIISVPIPQSGFGGLVGVDKTFSAMRMQMRWNSAAAIATAAPAASVAAFILSVP